jgi:muramidase (phage lysozyme)
MAKKSSADLKAEGAELSTLIATARRRPMNFAMLIGKEGIFLEAHPTKAPDVMRRQAKANGGGPKGAQGVMAVSGKLIELTCETDDVPRNLGKLAKRHFSERGIAFKVVLVLPGGERVLDEEEGEGAEDAGAEAEAAGTDEAPAPDPRGAELAERHRILATELGAVEGDSGALERKLTEAETALAAEDFDGAAALLDEVAAGLAALHAAPPPVDTEALRATLQAEFEALKDDLAFVQAHGSKGVQGKATQIAAMFAREIAGADLKKAGAVLALLRTFVKTEKGKIDLAVATAAADRMDPDKVAAAPAAQAGSGKGRAKWPLPGTEDLPLLRPDPKLPAAEDPAVLNVISFIGAMEAPKGYDQIYGASVIATPKPLTQMTVDEVLAWQKESTDAGSKSSASGQYQIIRKTLAGLKTKLELDGSELFDKAMQDRMGLSLMEGRGLEDWRSGKITDEQFCLNLSKEWAAIPVPSGPNEGKSFYDGDGLNSAQTSADMMLGVLSGKSPHGRPEAPPEAPAEDEATPEQTTPPPAEEQGWGDWAREQAGDLGDSLADAASGLRDAGAEALDAIKDGAASLYDSGKDFVEDNLLRAELMAKGYPADLRELLVERVETDPAVLEEATGKLAELQSLKLSDAEEFTLLSLYFTDPTAFAATSAALAKLDPGGSVDISPEAIAKSEADVRAADDLIAQNTEKRDAADAALDQARKLVAGLQAERDTMKGGVAAAEFALQEFEAKLGDLTALPPAELAAAEAERARLATELKAITDAVAAKETELTAATADEAVKATAQASAQTTLDASINAYWAKKDIQDEQDNKRGLLDALSHGRLSPGAVPPFDDAQKAALIETYGTSPALGRSAMDIAATADDPGMVVKNLPMITAKYSDGFADASGQAVQRNGAPLDESDRAEMAANALRMGARQGEDYFTGFDAYLKTGAQHRSDPSGGMDPAVRPYEKEIERQRQVALNRSVGMADSAMDAKGNVNFNSPEAKAKMEQMKFHPGSLLVFTPMVTENAESVKGLFEDPATAKRAQDAIKATSLPADDSDPERDRLAASTLVGKTVGKDPALVKDEDARIAVMSAMISPLSQGSIGSCFTTAPTRRIRENDPLRAMETYSALASDGMFEGHDKQRYPANLMAPEGDNLLMRSWEYSAADAAAEAAGGSRSEDLDNALIGLDGIEAIVGADAWAGGGQDADGDLIVGIESKIQQAVTSELIYRYNTGPTPAGGVGGDGSSNSGFFELLHNGTLIDTEAKFYTAIKDIALRAAGETATSPKGLQIIALIETQDFKDKIADGVRYEGAEDVDFKPWEIGGGGWGHEVEKVLNGGAPQEEATPMIPSGNDPNAPPGKRTRDLLDGVLATDPAAMTIVSTSGDEAHHAFNLLPSNPSLDRIRDPDSEAKIQAELLDPGAAIAKADMPVSKVQNLYQAEIRKLSSWAWKHPAEQALLTQALARTPTSAMTPGELAKLIDTETTAFRQAVATRRADDWKAAEIDAGRTVSNADYASKKTEFEDEKARDISQGTAERLANAFPLPEVLIADTNWGGADSHTFFVIAPDPRSGELQLWKKDEVTGALSAADEYREASWTRMKE